MEVGCPWLAKSASYKFLEASDEHWWGRIYFMHMDYELPLFNIHSSFDSPLTGDNVQAYFVESKPYGPGAMIDVLPTEWLYTAETKPQVLVTAGGMKAVCPNMNCDYEYVSTIDQVTDFELNGNEASFSLSGQTESLDSVKIGTVDCGITENDGSQVKCSIGDKDLVTGPVKLNVLTANGHIPVAYSDAQTTSINL
jgi:hypothetical protein